MANSEKSSKPRVLVIGWDAADWKLINPLLEQGHLPSIERMINRGVMGNLATLRPILSPMLWNSIATGMRPQRHGIYGFTEVNQHTREITPSLSTSRKVKAIWNILSQEGFNTHVVSWFASHPPEPINGVCISDFYSKMPARFDSPFEMHRGCIHPESATERFKELRVNPHELDPEILQMFVPLAHKVDQEKDARIFGLGKLIAEAFTIHNAVTSILEHEDWDFVGVYYCSIDHFCHMFMQYHPPRMEMVSEEDFEIFQHVVNAAYLLHDRMLGRLLQLAGDDTTVIVCSDHGFHSDELRPVGTPAVPAGPAVWHREQGMILMQGPNVRQDELVHGANLLDIAPTVLHVMGLPIGRDMDGRALLEVFEDVGELKTIESWEKRKGEHPDGMHPDSAKISREESRAILDQFVALGYIEAPQADADEAANKAERELQWNLARSQMDAGNVAGVIPILEQIVDDAPERTEFVLTLANCLQAYELFDEADELARAVLPDESDDPDVCHTLADFALGRGDAQAALEHLRGVEEGLLSDTMAHGTTARRWLALGASHARLRDWTSAFDDYRRAVEADPEFSRGYLGMAQCMLRLRRYDDAVDLALDAVELEHHLAEGHHCLGIALTRCGDYARAVDAFTTALRYRPFYVHAHRMLVVVYHKLGHEDQAQTHRSQVAWLRAEHERAREVEAQTRIALAERTRERIKRVRQFTREQEEKKALEAAEKAKQEGEAQKADGAPQEAQQQAQGIRRSGKTFVIVSGLPRSGTSLVMQMLQAGGMEIMTDHERAADEDNPEGYLEWEAIKQIKSKPELMDQAEGKVTKVISMLIPHLPLRHEYKIIFVMRPINEIVASQQKMIKRRGTKGADLDPEALERNLKRHRDEIFSLIKQRRVMTMLSVGYRGVIEDPQRAIKRIVEFLGEEALPHADRMASVVKPELYRNRMAPDAAAAGSNVPDESIDQ